MAKRTKDGVKHDKKASPNPKGYPSYPKSEDIYRQAKEEESIDPVNPSRKKEPDPDPHNMRRGIERIDKMKMGEDLDVPGSELDDTQEEIGSEDEENNYYSLGGEKDLEEEKDYTKDKRPEVKP